MLNSIEEKETASNRLSAIVSIEDRTGGFRDSIKKKTVLRQEAVESHNHLRPGWIQRIKEVIRFF